MTNKRQRMLIHDLWDLAPGNYTITGMVLADWGASLTVLGVYRNTETTIKFRLLFQDCRSLEWYMQHDTQTIRELKNAQLLTHDLGVGNYERTARLATTIAEVIIAYGKLKLERVK